MATARKKCDDRSEDQPLALPATRRRGRPANDAAHAVPEERVLDLAFASVASLGYEGTTVRELAKQLGVSHNLLNVCFGSKANLWRRAVDSRVTRYGEPVFLAFDVGGLEPKERLRLLVHRFAAWAAANPEFVGISYAECRRDTWRLDYLVDLYIRPFKQRLDELFAEVAARHRIRKISSNAFMALLVQGAGFYFAARPMIERIGDDGEARPEQAEAQIAAFAEFLLAGLLSGLD